MALGPSYVRGPYFLRACWVKVTGSAELSKETELLGFYFLQLIRNHKKDGRLGYEPAAEVSNG
jgi:hypothetical protein